MLHKGRESGFNLNMSLNTTPKISIVMSVLNGENNYVRDSLESILGQRFTDYEFIIVDDGSRDNTYAIMREYSLLDKRIKLIRNDSNIGIVESVNKCIRQASAKYIARMDCGDIADKDRLEIQYRYLEDHSDYVLVASQVEWITMAGEKLFVTKYPSYDEKIREQLFTKNCILHQPAVMMRRINNLYYRNITGTNNAEDYDYWLRLSLLGKLYLIDAPLIKVRMNPDGTTYSRKIEQIKSVDAIYHSFICTLKNQKNTCELHRVQLTKLEILQQRSFYRMNRYALQWRRKSKIMYCALKWLSLIVSPYYAFTLIRQRVSRLYLPFDPLFSKYRACCENTVARTV